MIFIEELALNTHTRHNLFVKNGVYTFMKGRKIIDIGCGTGFFSNIISQYAKNLICLDISKGNIEHAKKVLKLHGVKFLISDCKSINLPSNEVDIVFCTAVIEHFEDPVSVLREFYRILKPDGYLILTVDINPKITGKLKQYFIRKGQLRKGYTQSHPEVHKKTIFSDDRNPCFFDISKLKNFLVKDFSLLIEDYGGGVISNIIDTLLIFMVSLGKHKEKSETVNLFSHYHKLKSPLICFYIRTILPVIKLITKIDNFKLDSFTALLVFQKTSER